MASDPQPRAPAPPSRPKPGRPLSAKVGDAILEAAVDVLTRKGIRGLTLDAVAARARVGKPTIYRRWPSKGALVAAAIAPHDSAPDGDTIVALVRETCSVLRLLGPDNAAATAGDATAVIREVITARRGLLAAALERSGSRDPELNADMMLGAVLARLLSGGDIDDPFAERVASVVPSAPARA